MNIVRKIHDQFRVKTLAGSTLQSPTSTSDSTGSGNTYVTITGGSLGGGGLSEADRSKLNSIEQGAQVNQDAFSKVLLETTNREQEQQTTTSSSIIANIPSDTANIRLVGNYPIKVSLESVSLFNYNTVTTTGDIVATYNVSYNENGNIVIDYVSGTLFSTTDIEIIRIQHREETLATYNNTQFEYTESEGTIIQFIIPYQGTNFSSIQFCRYETSSSESTEGTETVRELSVITELPVSPTKQQIITLSDTNANYWKYEEDENGNRYLWTDCNVYSTKEVSAYGKAEGQEMPTILNLSQLQDVALTNLSNNQVLVYNASSQKWVNIDANNLGISADNLKTLTITVNGTSYTYNPASSNQSINITTITLDDILPYISNKLDREEFFKWFTINYDSNNNVTSIQANYDFYSIKGISAYGLGDIGGITRTTLQSLDDVSLSNLAVDNMLAYNGSKWVNIPMSQVRGVTSWADLENKPTTISGFGITDAYTKTEVNTKISEVSSKVTELSSSKADATIQVIAGDGLTGGGNLQQDITISLQNLNSTGTYYKVTVDAYGRVTSGISQLTIADIQNLQTQLDSKLNISDFNTWFTIIYNTDGTIKNIRANYDFYSVGEVSAYGIGDEEKKTYTTLAELNDVQLTNVKETDVLVYNGTKWINVDQSTIKGAQSWVDIQNKPTTISGFGIVDAYTKTEIDNKLSPINSSITSINSSINTINTNISDLSSSLSSVSTKLNNFLEGSDTDTIINKWKELEAFLAGYTQTQTLADLLSIKADKSTLDNYLPLGGGTMTGVITAATTAGTNGGILLGTTYLTSISGSTIFYKNNAIRFGTSTIWSYNDWAGLKYNTTEKTIYLGVPDNNIFGGKAINGTIKTPGITTIYVGDTDYVYHTSNLVVDWSKEIVINTPTTLAGYGITDGVNNITFTGNGNAITAVTISNHLLTFTKGETFLPKSTFDDLFEKVNVGTADSPVYAIKAKYHLYSVGEVSAYEFGEAGGTGVSSLEELIDVQLTNLVADSILKYNGTKWINIPITDVKGVTSWDEIEDKPSTFTPSAHTHTVADITDISTKYVSISTTQTVSGLKTFTSTVKYQPTYYSYNAEDIEYRTTSGTLFGGIGAVHNGSRISYFYIGKGSTPWDTKDGLTIGDELGFKGYTVWHSGNTIIPTVPTKLSAFKNDSGYISSITKAMVEGVLTGNITSHTHSYLPLSGGTVTGTLNAPQFSAQSGGVYANYRLYLPESASSIGSTTRPRFGRFNRDAGSAVLQLGTSNLFDIVDAAWSTTPLLRVSSSTFTYKGTAVSLNGHTHSYLPLSGGTMTGSIKFNTNSLPQKTLSYVCGIDTFANGGEMGWMGGSSFVAQFAPTLTGTGASGTWGISITGNAATATALTTSAGSATLPIYFSSGKPVACTASSVFSNLSNSGNSLSVTVAGQNRTLTINYASNAGNADKLDGYHLTSTSSSYVNPWNTVPVIKSDGVMEIGRYLDFHFDNTSNLDYSCRLQTDSNSQNVVRLPSASGTLALVEGSVAYATSAGNADTLDGYHATDLVREFWTGSPGYNGNTYNSSSIVTFSYSNNTPYTGVFIDLNSNGYGIMFNTAYGSETHLAYRRHGVPADGGMGSWRYLIDDTTIGSQSVNYANSAGLATKLQTPRTIWGQSFDGTGNVIGDLTGVGHIYMTSRASYIYNKNNQRVLVADYRYTILGYGTAGAGLPTYIDGSPIYMRCGTSYIEALTIINNGNVGIGTNSPSVKLHVAGDIAATGEVTAKASSSDIRLKTDISDYKALSIIRSHRSIKYHWNEVAKANADIFNDDYWHYGLIAQDVQRDMPQMVSDVFKDYLVINYERLIPICWKGLQEVDDEVTKLKKRVKQLEKRLQKYESTEVFYTKGND